MLYITRVASNIKQGVDVFLGPRTLLCGANGSGKSSVIQAIEVACANGGSDIEGREFVRQKAALLRMFNPEREKPYVQLTLSNGQCINWTPDHADSSVVNLDFFDVKEIMRGDAKAIKAWISDLALGKMEQETILAPLMGDQRDCVSALMKRERLPCDFAAVAAAAKKEVTSLRRRATTEENTIDAIAQRGEHPASQELREKVKRELSTLKASLESRKDTELERALMQAHAKLTTETDAFEAARSSLAGVNAKLEALHDKHPHITELYAKEGEKLLSEGEAVLTLQEIFNAYVNNCDLDRCQLCHNDKPDFAAAAASFQTRASALLPLQEYAKLATTKQQFWQICNDLAQKSVQTQENIASLEQKLKAQPVLDVAATIAKIQEKTAWLTKQTANDANYQQIQTVRATVHAARTTADILARAAETLDREGMAFVANNLNSFRASLQKYCPNEEIGVDLDVGRIGFVRNGHLHTALSGGEWSILLIALCCLRAERAKDNNSTLHVVAPDDRGWDVNTLRRVQVALRQAPCQILLMTTMPEEALYINSSSDFALERWSYVTVTKNNNQYAADEE